MSRWVGGHTATTYPDGQVGHELASCGVTTSQEPEDVGCVGDTLDSQVGGADDGREVVHHQRAHIAGGTDIAVLGRSPSVYDMSGPGKVTDPDGTIS